MFHFTHNKTLIGLDNMMQIKGCKRKIVEYIIVCSSLNKNLLKISVIRKLKECDQIYLISK
jgi:hypothetical protein